jgi:hypothetical protein
VAERVERKVTGKGDYPWAKAAALAAVEAAT